MERRDIVNESLTLIQDTEGLTFGTDALLLSGYVMRRFARGCELGAGSGIISMLLLSREKLSEVVALEVQESYSALTKRNAEENGFSERLTVVNADLRDYKPTAEFDAVYTNPPYMKVASGKECELSKKNIARHEVMGDIFDFAKAAARLLKYGGHFYAVYRPDRLADLMAAMRAVRLEPKRMTFVHADSESEPSMVLIEAVLGGRCGALITKPLLIYRDREHKDYGSDMNYIMKNGSFPSEYKR